MAPRLYRRALVVLLCLFSLPTASAQQQYPVPVPEPVESPLLVGCYYFPGHFNAMRWVPMARYRHPYPLLGYYRDGEPEVADWHIKWAVEHGIDYWAFDWYYDHKTGSVHEHNNALELGFLNARYRDLIDFAIFWCNEERSDEAYTEEQMLLLGRTLRDRYFAQSNYLRFEGRPVVFISRPLRFIDSFGVPGSAAMWRKISAEAGAAIYPVALHHQQQETLKAAGFAAISAYNYAGVNVPEGQKQAPYDTMVSGYESTWQVARGDGVLPYIVPVSPGWDSRPWYGDSAMVRTNPRPEKFRRMCEAAKSQVDPRLNAVIVECWNEFGEGSYIEPCTQYGFGYLDALRDAFCPDSPHHLDLTPQQLGLSAPQFAEIPIFGEAEIAAQGGNVLYNPGFEKTWGWVYYAGADARTDSSHSHSGARSGQVTPADGGLKSWYKAEVRPGDEVEVWAWVLCGPGASATVQCALFSESGSWLGRYAAVGRSSAAEWTLVTEKLTMDDPEARQINLEIVPRGGAVWVDDAGVRPPSRRTGQ